MGNSPTKKQKKEARRLRAIELIDRGLSVTETALQLGVDRTAVLDWNRTRRKEGLDALRMKGPAPPPEPPTLTEKQLEKLDRILHDGPERHGCGGPWWVESELCDLIERRFKARFNSHDLNVLFYELEWKKRGDSRHPESVARNFRPGGAPEKLREEDVPKLKAMLLQSPEAFGYERDDDDDDYENDLWNDEDDGMRGWTFAAMVELIREHLNPSFAYVDLLPTLRYMQNNFDVEFVPSAGLFNWTDNPDPAHTVRLNRRPYEPDIASEQIAELAECMKDRPKSFGLGTSTWDIRGVKALLRRRFNVLFEAGDEAVHDVLREAGWELCSHDGGVRYGHGARKIERDDAAATVVTTTKKARSHSARRLQRAA